MGSTWRKLKFALGFHRCVYVPMVNEDAGTSSDVRFSAAALLSPIVHETKPTTPNLSSYGLTLPKRGSRSSKTCAICLNKMKQGAGKAIFTAECTHSFHFNCITANVKHGNQICPVCRAKWKEVPFKVPNLGTVEANSSVNAGTWAEPDGLITMVRRLPPVRREASRRQIGPVQSSEPRMFDDDECLDLQPAATDRYSGNCNAIRDTATTIEVNTHTEVSAVARNTTLENFTVLVHLKAVSANPRHSKRTDTTGVSQGSRAPVDLVTVLDISGSMAGTKLALLKRAMGFVIQNLGSNDRLSVIAFSSAASRLFPLRRMCDVGRQQALQAVNSLIANGGTNIAEGLRKSVKVMAERREKNVVASIILLSDGQDTYAVNGSGGNRQQTSYQHLLPSCLHESDGGGFHIPVHTFGFGADHDASSMHSISQISGGTFSFIETESVIQNAFAQCIGGLLSVVAQDLTVQIASSDESIRLKSLKAGSYPYQISGDGLNGCIDIGELYADEERDFLLSLNIPVESASDRTSLMKVKCVYRDSLTCEIETTETEEISLERPTACGEATVSVEVDRQKNRLEAAESMSLARSAAEQGDLNGAVSILESCRKALSQTVSSSCNDRLCVALDAELKEMQERLASRHVYEASGRAYILSGLSSHSWQRATARGDSTDGSSLVQSYQTPSMTEMLTRSQTMLLASPTTRRLIQPLSSQPKPR